jgi:hypothetical protein
LSRSVSCNRPKVLIGRSQKGMRVGSSSSDIGDGGTRTRRTRGRSLPIRLFPIGQQGKPHSSRRNEAAVSRPQGRGMAEG